MHTTERTSTRQPHASPEGRELIKIELASVLASPHFANSKRYPAFLAYVVQKTLQGESAELKERTLGIEVFQRPPDYDTNSDTIVRVTAGEVRKRLALVYHESSTEHEVQILLPAGSYVPEFHHRTLAPAAPSEIAQDVITPAALAPNPSPTALVPARGKPVSAIFAMAVLFALLAAGAFALRARHRAGSVERFWQPIHAATTPVILCPGALVFSTVTESGVTPASKTADYPYVSMATANSLIDLVDLFAKTNTPYVVKPISALNLTDIREHPVVLLGAYNNDWTVRVLSDLRFRFAANPEVKIYDSQKPSTVWQRDPALPYKDADDYAIFARFHDKLTDNVVFVIAGIGKNGTEAAAQFVTSPRYLDLLDSTSKDKDWASKNVEVVIKTKVVDSKTGAPAIEAIEVW